MVGIDLLKEGFSMFVERVSVKTCCHKWDDIIPAWISSAFVPYGEVVINFLILKCFSFFLF